MNLAEAAKKLKELETKLKPEIANDKNLSLVVDHANLDLEFNNKTGLDSYESISAGHQRAGFLMTYFGLEPFAKETFLSEAHAETINTSPVLRSFGNEVKQGIKNVNPGQDGYSRLFVMSRSKVSYTDAERAIYFFFDVFKEKSKTAAQQSLNQE